VSDSFEALRASAAAGVVVAVLPLRVANRNEDLIEINPPHSKFKDRGEHRIMVAGQRNCDRLEIDFLADETARLLNRSSP
jgi:DNA-binding transcriptional LysR family regulator